MSKGTPGTVELFRGGLDGREARLVGLQAKRVTGDGVVWRLKFEIGDLTREEVAALPRPGVASALLESLLAQPDETEGRCVDSLGFKRSYAPTHLGLEQGSNGTIDLRDAAIALTPRLTGVGQAKSAALVVQIDAFVEARQLERLVDMFGADDVWISLSSPQSVIDFGEAAA